MWPRLLLGDLVELWPHPGQRTKSEGIHTVNSGETALPAEAGVFLFTFLTKSRHAAVQISKKKALSALLLTFHSMHIPAVCSATAHLTSTLMTTSVLCTTCSPRQRAPTHEKQTPLTWSSWVTWTHCTRAGILFLHQTLRVNEHALFDDFNLTQCVTSPTRFSADATSCSVLDVFATNRPELVQSVEISDPISDHWLKSNSSSVSRKRSVDASPFLTRSTPTGKVYARHY